LNAYGLDLSGSRYYQFWQEAELSRHADDYSFFEIAEQENAGKKNRALHPHCYLYFPLPHFPVPQAYAESIARLEPRPA